MGANTLLNSLVIMLAFECCGARRIQKSGRGESNSNGIHEILRQFAEKGNESNDIGKLLSKLATTYGDDNGYGRQRAARLLGQMANNLGSMKQQVIDKLFAAMWDEKSYVQDEARTSLLKIDADLEEKVQIVVIERTLKMLGKTYGDKDGYGRQRAARLLGQMANNLYSMRQQVIDKLFAAMRDEKSYVWDEARKSLLKIDPDLEEKVQIVVIERTLKMLATTYGDKDGYGRQRAARSLGQMANNLYSMKKQVIDKLFVAMRDEKSYVRDAARKSLLKIDADLKEKVLEIEAQFRQK